MNRLSALDAAFLYLETPETPMSIGSVTIFAPAAASADRVFKSFRDHTTARLDLLPSYRRRPAMTPLGIDHPVWVDEDEIDLDYHIRRRALPRPGTMDQLRSLVADLHMVPLDRTRPLWQYYLIEGLENGGFAVYIKVHHADMDGVSGQATLPVIYDFSPQSGRVAEAKGRHDRAEKPGFRALVGDAIRDVLAQDLRLISAVPRLAMALARVGRRAAGTFRLLPGAIGLAPKTLFNVAISRERSYGTASISLADVKRVAKARHATINDVVLAVSAGALYRYLAGKKALPKRPLIAAVPVSLREPGHTEMNNQVAVVLCSLATDVPDPLNRLAAIAASAQDSRGRFIDIKDIWPTEIPLLGVPILISGLARLADRTRLFDFLPGLWNLWISNVPGPRQPMYCAGAPALHYFPISIPYHGCALNITVQSYLDSVDFGLTACRRTVPDVQSIAEHIVEEFAALKAAADAISDAGAIEVIEAAQPLAEGPAPRRQAPAGPSEQDLVAREPVAVAAASIGAEKRQAGKPRRRPATTPSAPTQAVKHDHH